jgi:hypothetical protein
LTVPVRAAPVFAATISETVALAVPVWLDPIVIHDAVLAADQLHPVRVVTANASRPPAESIASAVRLKAYVHGAPA